MSEGGATAAVEPSVSDDRQPAAKGDEPLGPAPVPWRLGNRPPLTGIRAPLMAFVLIFHSNFQTLPGSWASLGMFFVLSGFLITAMLAGEHERTGAVSLKNFYSRRAVRLLPPLFLTVVLLAIYAGFGRVYSAANALWTDVAAAIFYFADYRSALGHEPTIGWLSQCWSLAVEEQFYLIWAILLFVALRYGNRRTAYGIAALGVIVSTADRLWVVLRASHWDSLVAGRAYYAFDTRADALFLGCILGLLATGGHLDGWGRWPRRFLVVAAVASTATFVWILFNVGLAARSLPLYWIPVSNVAALVIITYFLLYPVSLSSRLLGIPLLVLLGNMTYTIYLVHWPVYIVVSPFGGFHEFARWPFWALETLRITIVLAIAFASWYLIERPLMVWRRRVFASRGGPEAASEQPVAAGPPVTIDQRLEPETA